MFLWRHGSQPSIGRPGHSLFFSRFSLRSLLIFYPWITIALLLILLIFRFAHRSIALKKTSGSLLDKSAKTLNPLKLQGVDLFKIRALPHPAWRHFFHTVQGHTTYKTEVKEKKRRQSGAAFVDTAYKYASR